MEEITLLSYEEIEQSEILKIYGRGCAVTDFSILLGVSASDYAYTSEGNSLKDRAGWWWTKTQWNYDTRIITENGIRSSCNVKIRAPGARPVLPYLSIFKAASNGVRDDNGILEVEYGEYPKTIVSETLARTLERAYSNKTINQTGKSYTTDSVSYLDTDTPFQARTHIEYEYNGKKYIRFVADENCIVSVLSDGRTIKNGKVYWVEVEPIKWMIDEKKDIALSKYILFSGVQFNNKKNYDGNFKETDIYKFMINYFVKDIVPSNHKSQEYQKITSEQVEIKKLLDQIYEMIDNMPTESKYLIIKKINQIIEDNKNNKSNSPKSLINLDKIDNHINLSLNSNENKKINSIENSLKMIILSLTNQKEYTELINKINDYRKIIDEDITELPGKTEDIEDIIKSLIYYANLMDKENKLKIITSINNILNKPQKSFEKILSNEIDDKVELSLEFHNSPRQTLTLDLSNYLFDVTIYYQKHKDSIRLLKELTNSDIIEAKDIKDISDIINNTNYAILKIDNPDDLEKLSKEFKEIKDKYSEIIRLSMNKEENSYEEIVLSLHKELEPLLSELNEVIKKEQIIKNIRNDLLTSIKIIKELKVPDDIKPSVITLFTEEIINEIKDSSLNHSETSELLVQILGYINDRMATLENIDLTVNKEELEKETNAYFANLYLSVAAKIMEIDNYKRENFKNQEILTFLESYQENRSKNTK